MVARDDEAHRALSAMVKRRELERTYLALVEGRPRSRSGTIDAPLGRDHRAPEKRSVRGRGARDARTHFTVLEPLPADTLVEARLETGRTHQIRVHFAAIGHPVAGDPRYGNAGRHGLERQFLHSARLGFDPPVHRRAGGGGVARCRRTSQQALAAGDEASECRRPATESATRGLSASRSYTLRRPVTDPQARPRGPARPHTSRVPGGGLGCQSETKGASMSSETSEAGLKELLQAGLHFGHQTRRWNPRMRRYIHGERDGIHIIDLLQTEQLLAQARDFATEVAGKGGIGAVRRHEEAGARLGQELGRPQRHAVRQPALARRPADQLPDDVGADRPPARAHRAQGRGPARAAADQGADVDGGRARRSSSTTSAASAT